MNADIHKAGARVLFAGYSDLRKFTTEKTDMRGKTRHAHHPHCLADLQLSHLLPNLGSFSEKIRPIP